MTLQGSLDAFSLPDIFQLLSFSQKSGALHLKGREANGLVYFHNGEVYFASAKAGDTLGNALVRSGVVPEDVWKQAVGDARKRGVADVLVTDKGVDSDRLEAFIRERVEEAVFDLLRWERGRFDFRAGETHSFGPMFLFAVEPLISEGRRRLDEWAIITESIPSAKVAVEMVRSLPEEHREVTLTREEWRIISCIDAHRSVTELAVLLGEGEFHTCQILHGLVSTGLVHVLDRPLPEVDVPADEMPDIEGAEEDGFSDDDADEEGQEAAESEPEVEEEPELPAAEAEPEREPEPVAEVEPEPEIAEQPTTDDLVGLSLAEAAAQLEDGDPSLDALEEADGAMAPSVHSTELGALEADEPPVPDRSLSPSVSSDLFTDLGRPAETDDDLLSDVLSRPMVDGEPVAEPALSGPVDAQASSPRMGSAALAREFSQIAATLPATDGAHALEAQTPAELEQLEPAAAEQPPSPKSAGLNKTLILRLISGVKDL